MALKKVSAGYYNTREDVSLGQHSSNGAAFCFIPKGAKQIRVELPALVLDYDRYDLFVNTYNQHYTEVRTTNPSWAWYQILNEVHTRLAADSRYYDEIAPNLKIYPTDGVCKSIVGEMNFISPTDFHSSTRDDSHIPDVVIAHNAGNVTSCSLQCCSVDGKLLVGTPLTGRNVSIGDRVGISTSYQYTLHPPNVWSFADGSTWLKSGVWADWFTSNKTPQVSAGTIVSGTDLSDLLQELHPDFFKQSFMFDDTTLNDNAGELVKLNDSNEHIITTACGTVYWTGNVGGDGPLYPLEYAYSLGLMPFVGHHYGTDPVRGYQEDIGIKSTPYSYMRMDEATDDILIGAVSGGAGYSMYAEWYVDDGTDPSTPDPTVPQTPDPIIINTEPPAYPNQIRYTNLEEVTPVHRGDDVVIPKPYAGIAVFRDGKYIVAGREKGRLVLVGPDDLVISSGDPFSLRHDYDKLICYGIAMHVSEESLYLLVGEEGSTDLYITRIEIIGRPSGCSAKCDCDDDCDCTTMSKIPADAVAFQGNYYKVYDQVVTWEEARIECERLGGHLCTIMSKEENNCVKELVTKAIGTPPSRWYGAWIGCYGDRTQWYWVNGAKVSYTSWTPGQPDYVGSGPVYQGVIMVDGLWHDDSIGGKCNHFVCKWTGYPQPKSIPHDAVKFQRHYYKVYKQNVTWEEARTLCSDLGGHLAIITSQEENNLVQSLVSKAIGTPLGQWYGAWIGCERRDTGWYWVDDSKVNYTNWATGQPDTAGGIECYGEMIVDGHWNDYPPSIKLDYFVCEWPEIDPGSPRFKWNPAFDIRLPSMTAKNIDYNDFQPIYWGVGYELGGYSPNGLQWVTHLLRKKQPDVINDWSQLHDDLAVNLTDFPTIGPILPEYKPCITGVGARVMVSVVNVQVYQCSFDMKVWYENKRLDDEPSRWTNLPSSIRAMWEATLRSILKKRGLINETRQQTTLDGPGVRTPPVLEDWFPEGKDKSWWVEPIYTYNKYGEIVYYHGCWLHQKVTFQYPFPASSVVTVYPDLGMIDGISHIGSGTVCAVPRDMDVREDFSWAHYRPYKASIDADHRDLNKYMATGIMAAEADIDLLLSPLDYYIPSNVLAWADGIRPLKWKGSEVTTITALTEFMEWFWLDVYLYQQKLDPVAYVRKQQQDTTLVKMGSLKENKLCKTRRDGSRSGTSSAEDYKAGSLVYPWSTIDGVQSACTEICSGVVMAVTPTKIYRGDIALHKFVSIYEGRVLGEGLDIYIGKVLIGKEKIVKVKLQHAGYSMMQLKNFKIEIIPDMNFPYWQYVELSLDQTTWSESITWNKRQLMPVSELYNAEHYEFEFWVKVLCSSPYEDPKPVKVKTTYERTGS